MNRYRSSYKCDIYSFFQKKYDRINSSNHINDLWMPDLDTDTCLALTSTTRLYDYYYLYYDYDSVTEMNRYRFHFLVYHVYSTHFDARGRRTAFNQN